MLTIVAAVLALATTQSVPGARFESLAAPIEHAVRLTGDAKLVQSVPIPNQIVPAGTVALKAHAAIVTPSYVNVPVEIDVNGSFIRQIFVGYRVQRYVQTAVAARDLVAGSVIDAGDVRMERVVSYGAPVNGVDALVGRKVVANVRSGAAVTLEMTRIDQIVKAGQTVTLIVSDGGVSIVADVVANTSGGLGEHISLYNPQTHKMLTGTIVGPDRVELNLTGDVQ
jgi:flagella basal body P-ring formation protein FlgA